MRLQRTIAVLALGTMIACMPQVERATPLQEGVTLRINSTRDTAALIIRMGQQYAIEQAHISIITEIEVYQTWQQRATQQGVFITHEREKTAVWQVPIARDALGIVVHPDNPVNDLSLDSLRRIYQGNITSWSQLGGNDIPIIPMVFPPQHNIQRTFQRLVMGQRRITPNAQIAISHQQRHDWIAVNQGGIVFMPMSQIQTNQGQAGQIISIDDIPANAQTISASVYPLPLTIFAIGTQSPDEDYQAFVRWIQSERGQALLAPTYFPLR